MSAATPAKTEQTSTIADQREAPAGTEEKKHSFRQTEASVILDGVIFATVMFLALPNGYQMLSPEQLVEGMIRNPGLMCSVSILGWKWWIINVS